MTKRSWTEPTMEMHNMRCESAITLRAACEGLGLPTSGSKIQLVERLLDADMTHARLQEEYGWRARQARADALAASQRAATPEGDTYWPSDRTVTLGPETEQEVGFRQDVSLDGMHIGHIEVRLIPGVRKRDSDRPVWNAHPERIPRHMRLPKPGIDWDTREKAVQNVIDQWLAVPRPDFSHPGTEDDTPVEAQEP